MFTVISCSSLRSESVPYRYPIIPVRYDTAHELKITIGEQSAVIEIGIAAADGSSAQTGKDTVTPDRIPMLFHENGRFLDVIFVKEEAEATTAKP